MHFVTFSRFSRSVSAVAVVAYTAGLLAIWHLSTDGRNTIMDQNITRRNHYQYELYHKLTGKYERRLNNTNRVKLRRKSSSVSLNNYSQTEKSGNQTISRILSHDVLQATSGILSHLLLQADIDIFTNNNNSLTQLDDFKYTTQPKVETTVSKVRDTVLLTRVKLGVNLTVRPTSEADFTTAQRVDVIPQIVHITWFFPTNTTFRFHQAVCLLSVQRYFRPKKIFFWHSTLPVGRWWEFTRHSVAHLLLVPYAPATSVNGRPVVVPEHRSDVARLDLIEEHGGLYLDLDVILVRSLDPLLKYDVTLGAETPHLLGSGLIIARPNATFIRLWRASYDEEFDDRLWNHQSVVVPMRLARQHHRGSGGGGLVHIEWYSINRPNWSERDWLYTPGKLWNWAVDNYAVHLWYREHHVDYDPISIRKLNTTLGEILRHVYYDHPMPMEDPVEL